MSGFDFDYSEFEKYAGNFEKLAAKLSNTELAIEALQRAGNKSLGTVKKATPVDGGTLRRGWSIEKVQQNSNGASLMLINNIEYAPFVEYGHRTRPGKTSKQKWVEGTFMLTNSIDTISRHLGDEADKLMSQIISMLEDL